MCIFWRTHKKQRQKMKQEQIMQIQMMEQEANQLNEQLQLIEQNVSEMQELKASLDEIENSDGKTEILANLGKRIYIPVEIKEKGKDLKLVVEVGRGNFVKKNISETKEVVDGQVDKLIQGKNQIMSRLEELQTMMMRLVGEIEKEQMKGGEK